MHFPIIAIESLETDKADFETDLSYEDSCLNEHTDYYGDIYDEDSRKRVIESDWLAHILDGIATLDTAKETITFLDKDSIRQTLHSYLYDLAKELLDKAEENKLESFDLRMAGEEYKNCSALFYWNYGRTSFDFVEDAVYHAGETVKIGNIFDAHI